jgi:hypothetical protein
MADNKYYTEWDLGVKKESSDDPKDMKRKH